MALILADAISQATFWIIISCLLVIGLTVIGFLIGNWARRRVFDPKSLPAAGFQLDDLRRLRQEGKLTQAEFEKMRDRVIAAAQKKSGGQPLPPVNNPKSNDRGKPNPS
ncbi:MAG TPA: hypothetical protein VMD30_06675 [Tepidisphaeraceae bacterium]|nr:hypothetical protein [Tepidisphaeraceae bacterium]